MANLTVVANIKAKSGKADLVKEALLKLIKPTRAEKGCVNYDLHQDNKDPSCFLFYENWQSWELWQDHMKTEHIKEYLAIKDEIIEEFVVSEMTYID